MVSKTASIHLRYVCACFLPAEDKLCPINSLSMQFPLGSANLRCNRWFRLSLLMALYHVYVPFCGRCLLEPHAKKIALLCPMQSQAMTM